MDQPDCSLGHPAPTTMGPAWTKYPTSWTPTNNCSLCTRDCTLSAQRPLPTWSLARLNLGGQRVLRLAGKSRFTFERWRVSNQGDSPIGQYTTLALLSFDRHYNHYEF